VAGTRGTRTRATRRVIRPRIIHDTGAAVSRRSPGQGMGDQPFASKPAPEAASRRRPWGWGLEERDPRHADTTEDAIPWVVDCEKRTDTEISHGFRGRNPWHPNQGHSPRVRGCLIEKTELTPRSRRWFGFEGADREKRTDTEISHGFRGRNPWHPNQGHPPGKGLRGSEVCWSGGKTPQSRGLGSRRTRPQARSAGQRVSD
jgi:hypothetical protein